MKNTDGLPQNSIAPVRDWPIGAQIEERRTVGERIGRVVDGVITFGLGVLAVAAPVAAVIFEQRGH